MSPSGAKGRNLGSLEDLESGENSIVRFIPIYFLWHGRCFVQLRRFVQHHLYLNWINWHCINSSSALWLLETEWDLTNPANSSNLSTELVAPMAFKFIGSSDSFIRLHLLVLPFLQPLVNIFSLKCECHTSDTTCNRASSWGWTCSVEDYGGRTWLEANRRSFSPFKHGSREEYGSIW